MSEIGACFSDPLLRLEGCSSAVKLQEELVQLKQAGRRSWRSRPTWKATSIDRMIPASSHSEAPSR